MHNDRSTFLIAGLGNAGRLYRGNRHNIGFQILDAFADEHDVGFSRVQHKALVSTFLHASGKVILAKPQTMMNDSGRSVAALVHYYRIPHEHLLVVFDDLDLPSGTLRMRPHGGSSGHRGMRSIITQLGSQDFPRLRVGIGRPPGRMLPRDYVLHDFDPQEQEILPEVLQSAVNAIRRFISDGIEQAMNDFNGQVIDEE